MTVKDLQFLENVSETSLIALYTRALESQRLDALNKDEKAVELVTRMSCDFDRVRQIPQTNGNRVVRILVTREMDRYARDFLARHPYAVVVHIGCGLDTRFERVDNRRVEWCDLDLPDVIELHRKYLGDEGERDHLLNCSVFDNTWLDTLIAYGQGSFLFLAEGVFMYFEDAQVESLVLTLRDSFPGAELVFDGYSPRHVWRHNLQTSTFKINLRVQWGIWHGQEIEDWDDGVRLMDEWGFIDDPTPHLDKIRWLRSIEALARTLRIYHFQLGEAAG